jgi:hypothetical protein
LDFNALTVIAWRHDRNAGEVNRAERELTSFRLLSVVSAAWPTPWRCWRSSAAIDCRSDSVAI